MGPLKLKTTSKFGEKSFELTFYYLGFTQIEWSSLSNGDKH